MSFISNPQSGGSDAWIASGGYLSPVGTPQVLYKLVGNDGLMNVPFRVNAATDVSANFVTYGDAVSQIAVSLNESGTANDTGNPPLNVYFGVCDASGIGCISVGDGAPSGNSLYVGSDSRVSTWNQVHIGPLTVHGGATIASGQAFAVDAATGVTQSLTITGGITLTITGGIITGVITP